MSVTLRKKTLIQWLDFKSHNAVDFFFRVFLCTSSASLALVLRYMHHTASRMCYNRLQCLQNTAFRKNHWFRRSLCHQLAHADITNYSILKDSFAYKYICKSRL